MNFDDSGFFGQRTTGAEQADNQPSQPQSGAQNLSRFFGEFIRRTENNDETLPDSGNPLQERPQVNIDIGIPSNSGANTTMENASATISVSQLEQSLFSNRIQPGMVQQQFPVNDHKEEHPVIFEALEMDITEFKPVNTSKEHVYSINELLELSKEIPKHTIESISSMLPKKKFWRLYQKHSEPRSGNNKTRGTDNSFDKKNAKGKGQKLSNTKKFGNKFGRNDRSGYVEENDINTNNDDLIALEEEIGSAPNSMMDFEAWKAKMKEMERKKKGLGGSVDSINPTGGDIPSRSSSALNHNHISEAGTNSISEFLNISSSKIVSNPENELSLQGDDTEIQMNNSPDVAVENEISTRESSTTDLTQIDENRKGGSSRFSSFFSTTSKSKTKDVGPITESHPNVTTADSSPVKQQGSSTGGSRLMSFFDNKEKNVSSNLQLNSSNSSPKLSMLSSKKEENANQGNMRMEPLNSSMHPHIDNHNITRQGQNMPPINRQDSDRQHTAPTQIMPGMVFPPNPQNNSAFFQDLLSKGKTNDHIRSSMPPPGLMHPGSGNNSSNMGNQRMMPMGMPPPGYPMGMPPPNMMPGPGMHGFPLNNRGQPLGQIPQSKPADSKDGNIDNLQRGNNVNMKGPQFMQNMPPPPGFAPLPNIPMGFPSGQFPPGMGPPPMNQTNFGKNPMNVPASNPYAENQKSGMDNNNQQAFKR